MTRAGCDSTPQEFYVRSPEEMYAAMPGHEEALATSARIAAMVEPHYESLQFGRRCFPSFQPPEGKTPEDHLRELCEEGVRKRYGENPPAGVQERLDHELSVINRMGFASYFLIVWDFVRYARDRGHSGLGSRLGLRGACQLFAADQPRLSDEVRPAVRAVSRPEPL